jgi:hypothetical protein
MKSLLLAFMLSIFAAAYGQSTSYSFVFLHKKTVQEQVPKEEVEKIMQGHMANIEDWQRKESCLLLVRLKEEVVSLY